MSIKVNVSLSAGGQLKQVSSRTLDKSHLTIGRDKECSLSLEDTQKHVSRVHAELDEEAGTYWMTVVSKVNPVLVNSTRHMLGERVALADGDVLTIGLYKLEILMPPAPVKAAPPPPPPRPPTPPPANFAEDMTYIPPAPAEPPVAPASAIPEDFSADMTYVPPSQSQPPAGSPDASPPNRTDDSDLDTTYIPRPPPAITPEEEITYVRPASELTNPMGRAMNGDAPGPDAVDEDFSEDMTYVRRPGDVPAKPPRPAAPATPPPPEEEDFSDDATYVRRPSAPPAPVAPVAKIAPAPADELDIELDFELPEGADLSEEQTLYRLNPADEDPGGEISEEPTQVRPSGHVPAPLALFAATGSADAPDAERALQAFCEGAGLRNLEIADPEAFLRDAGATVRAAIEGVMMLLLASTAVKKSLGADALDASDANPLNTMTDPAKVIAFLFDPAKRVADGPDPVQALGDACSDLRVHQIALMASIQAAVLSALQSVDPKVLEREQGSKLGGLSITRKSRLWDLSIAQHEKLSLEIGESVNRVFGPVVQTAYLAEVRRIRGLR